MIISPASINDIDIIKKIATITWEKTYTFLSKEQTNYMLDWMYSSASLINQMNEGHHFFIAINNNETIGFASVSKQSETVCKLNKLYVLPSTQKTGAGKMLLQQVIHFAKEHNCSELQLQVNRKNSAKDFYLKQGFEILYTADFEIGKGFFMNDYVMSLKIL